MYFYVKMIGDEPIIVESNDKLQDIIEKGDNICPNPGDVYFLVPMMTSQGQATVPVSAEDNGLDNALITIYSNQISMLSELDDNSSIVEGIKKLKQHKSGLVIPDKPKIVTA